MYSRASIHNKNVEILVQDTAKLLRDMDKDMNRYSDNVSSERMWEDHINRVDYYLKRRQKINERLYQKFDAFEESIVSGLPELPDRLILTGDDSSFRSNSTIGHSNRVLNRDETIESFEQFWIENCELLGWFTLRTFYIGTAFLLVSIALLMLAKLQVTYKNEFAGYLFCGFIFSSLFITFTALYFIKFTAKKRLKNEDTFDISD